MSLPLTKRAQKRAGSITLGGSYRRLRATFGRKNVSARFCELVLFVTEGLGDSVFSYLDDFVVFSSSAGKHECHLLSLMLLFERYGLFVDVKKCFLVSRSVQLLGHQVTNKGIVSLIAKRDQTLERPRPRTVTEL